jgi:DNA sulfur modification protein DndD
MRLRRLELNDFGPFKGAQHIDFGAANGVTVIYGDNNLGKTTLLNSVRWLFLGKFLERTGGQRSIADLVNRETLGESDGNDVTASVSATVEWNDETYVITRSVIRNNDRTTTRLDVVRGPNVLSLEDGESTLRQMMPEEIQQFFLFDAEALNRYEDLLHDPAAGEELKKAIERILGVPVLKNGIDDIKALTTAHNKVIAKLQTQDVKAKEAASTLSSLNTMIDVRTADIQRLDADIEQVEARRANIETQMQATEAARRLLENERSARRAVEAASLDHDAALRRYQETAGQTWQAVVAAPTVRRLAVVREQLAELDVRQQQMERDSLIAQMRLEIAGGAPCPCCGQAATVEHLADLGSGAAADNRSAIDALRRTERALVEVYDPRSVVLVEERWSGLQDAAARLHDARSELDDAEAAVAGVTDASIGDLPRDLVNVREQLRMLVANRAEAQQLLDADREYANRMAGVVAEQGGAEGAAATRKQALLADLQQLLSSAIDSYRETLKRRVEVEATNVFLSVRSDPDFTGLSINNDYGLSILHADGEVEPHRSAGYEHIVALSLVAALQRCAPVHGPIFMDMPFARLDPDHTQHTLRALPSIADQVVLVVHKGEVDHDEAANVLGSALVLERQLVRRSARHTDIRPLGDN